MKTMRIIFGLLISLPLAMFIDSAFLHPDFYETGALGELLFLVVGIPILTLNYWAWVYPEMLQTVKVPNQNKQQAITVPVHRNP